MATTASAPARALTPPRINPAADHRFYSAMAIAMAVTIFTGFGHMALVRHHAGAPSLSTLLLVHGTVFSLWPLLFIAQTSLVAAHKARIHMKLGLLSTVLVPVMLVLGAFTARSIDILESVGNPTRAAFARSFLTIQLGDLLAFGCLFAAAFYWRKNKEAHKRLMVLTFIAILAPGTARLPYINGHGPLWFYGAADLFLVAGIAYDLFTRRRLHPAYAIGGTLLVLSQPLRIMLAHTAPWQSFAHWFLS